MGGGGSKNGEWLEAELRESIRLTEEQIAQGKRMFTLYQRMIDLGIKPLPKPGVPEETRAAAIKRWKLDTRQFNWVIVGNCSCGKSTLINTLRGLKPTDAGAAKVGLGETTHETTAYPFPNFPQARLWDKPGAGTPTHPAGPYFEEHRIDIFDAVVLLTAGRFTEFDKAMLDICKERRVPCFLVRTRFDEDLDNDAADKGLETPNVNECMAVVKAKLLQFLGAANAEHLFVISGRISHRALYDMPRLVLSVLHATERGRFGRADAAPGAGAGGAGAGEGAGAGARA